MTGDPTFSITQFRCNDCDERFFVMADEDLVRQQVEHLETHQLGRCTKCHHWRKAHRPTDADDRKYLKSDQKVCCWRPLGMGDFCGCGGDGE